MSAWVEMCILTIFSTECILTTFASAVDGAADTTLQEAKGYQSADRIREGSDTGGTGKWTW